VLPVQQLGLQPTVNGVQQPIELPMGDALLTADFMSPSLRIANGLDVTLLVQFDDTAVFRTLVGSLAGKLTLGGVFDVGGEILIERFGDFEPDGTEEFTVIEADFVTGAFGDFFTNAVPQGGDTAFNVRTGDLEFDVEYTSTEVIVKNLSVIVPPCNIADLAGPSGDLTFADIGAFLAAFNAGCP
jgi:hypothetical protein